MTADIILYFGYQQVRLADLERQAVNDTFVILSDIWLDDEAVSWSTNYSVLASINLYDNAPFVI